MIILQIVHNLVNSPLVSVQPGRRSAILLRVGTQRTKEGQNIILFSSKPFLGH